MSTNNVPPPPTREPRRTVEYGHATILSSSKRAHHSTDTQRGPKLRANGHDADADALEAAVKEALGVTRLPSPDPANAPTVNRAMRRSLPKACGTCGAPVEAAKVSFSEEGAADCRFCGTVLVG